MYIKSIMATGPDKESSIINFTEGLNIIEGASDTGKSLVWKSINYCFGSKDQPFPLKFGYDKLTLELVTNTGENILIQRQLDSTKVDITTSLGFDTGTYPLTSGKSSKKESLNDVLLAGLGINDKQQIIKNSQFARQQLTWRTFLPLFFISSDNISSENRSAILPVQNTRKTAFLSSLLYLLTGDLVENSSETTPPAIVTAQKAALSSYISTKLEKLAELQIAKEKELQVCNHADIKERMDELRQRRNVFTTELKKAEERSRTLLLRIGVFEENLNKVSVLKNQYTDLKTQYVADIKRLTNIVSGESQLQNIPPNKTCPFCKGTISVSRHKSYIKAAKCELENATSGLNDLESVIADTKSAQERIKEQIQNSNAELDEIRQRINGTIVPKLNELDNIYDELLKYSQIQTEIEMLQEQSKSLVADRANLPISLKQEKASKYQPLDHLRKPLVELNDVLFDILEATKFPYLNSTYFDLDRFDLYVNGSPKNSNHGKGYCSFLNSVLALAFHKFMHLNAKFDPGFLFIDTPFLGLDEGVPETVSTELLADGLIRYITKAKDLGQVIFIENTNLQHSLNYESLGINLITFAPQSSRSGFFKSFRNS